MDETIGIMESHMSFPVTYAEDLGLTFIFLNKTDDYKPVCIVINEETNVKEFNLNGAKPGMNFTEISDKLGYKQIERSCISSESNIVYVLRYYLDGLEYSFVSYDEHGTGAQLFIALSERL